LSGDAPWQADVSLDRPAGSSGIGVLWARNKIAALLDAMRDGVAEDATRAQVIELALTHHLVTKYTSLVAIDRTPVRPANQPLTTAAQPTNLPAGWNYEAVFGELPRGATDSRFNLLIGALMMLAAMLLGRVAGVRGAR
jgi:Ca-activated chloride channel family protein